MKRKMKNLTYHNLLSVIRKIMNDKGYTFEEAEPLARNIFAEFEACPQGMSIEQRIGILLSKDEWIRQ